MRISNVITVFRGVFVVIGLTLITFATGCGPAATEATIDTSAPEEDPAEMAADGEALIEKFAEPAEDQ